MSSTDPDRPFEPIAGLPSTPDEARDALRQRLVAGWEPILADSGLRYQSAQFGVWHHSDGAGWWSADMAVSFGAVPRFDWARTEAAIRAAAVKNGWTQAGVSHGLNLRNGPLHLKGGCSVDVGCVYLIATGARIAQKVKEIPEGYTLRVEELESHLDPAAPAPTRR